MKLLVTGATGFVGRSLVDCLLSQTDAQLQLAVRTMPDRVFDDRVAVTIVPDISFDTHWDDALSDCDVVIHLAARVHVMDDTAENPLAQFRAINVAGTLNLARQAAEKGIKRFIFISSIKVNGENTARDKPFQVDDPAVPQCPYSISKYEAEQGLFELAAQSGMELVVLRPALVYGPGVKGNFQNMLTWLKKGTPLPLGRVNNKRSFVAVVNLVDLIVTCITHPLAANQVFLVSDGHDLSTTELLKKLCHLLDKRVLLLPIPVWVLKGVARLARQLVVADRLCGTLQVDISKASELLDWRPVVAVDDALRTTIEAYEGRHIL